MSLRLRLLATEALLATFVATASYADTAAPSRLPRNFHFSMTKYVSFCDAFRGGCPETRAHYVTFCSIKW